MSSSLLVSTVGVSCYPASMMNFIWFTNEKCSLSIMGVWNQVSEPKTQPSHKQWVLLLCPVGRCKSQAIPTSVWKWSFWASSPLKQGSCSATVSTSHDKQVCTHSTLWRQHYITTSKEYL